MMFTSFFETRSPGKLLLIILFPLSYSNVDLVV
jgi:hypothetical protein